MELQRLLMREMMNTCSEPGQDPASRIYGEDKLSSRGVEGNCARQAHDKNRYNSGSLALLPSSRVKFLLLNEAEATILCPDLSMQVGACPKRECPPRGSARTCSALCHCTC